LIISENPLDLLDGIGQTIFINFNQDGVKLSGAFGFQGVQSFFAIAPARNDAVEFNPQ